jgi:RNA polymerase sigma-70 factor (ECF subfamily)
MEVLSDNALVRQFVEGNPDAFNDLLNRHRKKVYTYICMLVKQKDVADDVFQETFIKVIRSLKEGRYEDNGKFIPWVLRIAHNQVIDYFRGQKQNNTVSADCMDWTDIQSGDLSDMNAEDRAVQLQIHKDVRALLDHLPVEQREIVIMRHYMDMSFKEISEQLNININTALGRMRYAFINMRKIVDQNKISLDV